MTTVYKIELCVIDHSEIGSESIKEVLEDTKYPNWCISPTLLSIKGKDMGKWHDEHPINYINNIHREVDKLFSGWQPINTAPEKEYVLVWHPDYGVTEAIFDPEEVSIEGNVVNHVWVTFYCEDWWYTSILDPAPLYWQSLPKPPQL